MKSFLYLIDSGILAKQESAGTEIQPEAFYKKPLN
jgi:hypothetical protein